MTRPSDVADSRTSTGRHGLCVSQGELCGSLLFVLLEVVYMARPRTDLALDPCATSATPMASRDAGHEASAGGSR